MLNIKLNDLGFTIKLSVQYILYKTNIKVITIKIINTKYSIKELEIFIFNIKK